MPMLLEASIILLLILANAVFAGSEIAIVSARKSRLQQRGAGDPRYLRALELSNDPNRFLSTVQIGITAVGVSAGAFGGATIAQQLAAWFADVPALAPWAQPLAIGVVVTIITYLALVIGELVPKRIALMHPERIAAAVAGPMNTASRIATPLVRTLGASTNLLLRALPVPESKEPAVTEDDVRVLLEQGTRAGVFLSAEQDIVENVFWLGDQRVDAVMTPRHRIAWIDAHAPVEEQLRRMVEDPQARYILCNRNLDDVVGVVPMKDVWPHVIKRRDLDLAGLATAPLFVPQSARALAVLEQFRTARVHVALVLDEYGAVQGLLTLADILEGLVGEIAEMPRDEIVPRQDGSWLVDASVRLETLRELLDLPRPEEQDRPEYRTIGGYVMHTLGRVPSAAEYVTWEGYRVEVVDMDGKRIDKVLVTRPDA